MKLSKVSIVGAGPGDPELITLKGLNALKKADVILYDSLIAIELLDHAPNALKIFVGKRAGKSCIKQDKINELIVYNAIKHGHVVRLKGGDPFIFGRGHEEMIEIKKANIQVDIIPGISSALSLPLIQHVPLTRRGISESFWVLTGSTKDHALSQDIRIAVKTSATLVILMGIRKLQLIVDILINEDKGDIPVMIVQNGATPQENKIVGTAFSIIQQAKLAEISTPGIIVIGEVVAVHPEFIQNKIYAICA